MVRSTSLVTAQRFLGTVMGILPQVILAIPNVETLHSTIWEFPKIGVPHFEVLIIGILLFRLLY